LSRDRVTWPTLRALHRVCSAGVPQRKFKQNKVPRALDKKHVKMSSAKIDQGNEFRDYSNQVRYDLELFLVPEQPPRQTGSPGRELCTEPQISTTSTLAYILQVLSDYPMPLAGHTIDICLHSTSLEQFSDTIDRSDR